MIKKRIQSLLAALHEGLYEREVPLRLAFLSAIAGESTFLIGPPGVAKSLIARRLKHAFKDAKAFEYLMNRFSTPDEIFGPVSIQELKNDKYHRQTEHYLPGAEVVFLDEIWKAGPSIQNTLLTVINEKVYRNGAQEVKLPLRALIAASNELPAEGQGLEALWDRFLVRYEVNGISDEDSFNAMITASGNVMDDPVKANDKIGKIELDKWKEEIIGIKVPEEVLKVIHLFRAEVQKYNEKQKKSPIYISDRRWKKVVRLLKSSAFLNERAEVDLVDLFLLPHCVWQEPGQYSFLEKTVDSLVAKHGYSMRLNLSGIKREIIELEKDVDSEIYIVTREKLKGLAVNSEGLVEIQGLDADFSGKYLKEAAIKKLSSDWQNVQIYDSNGDHLDDVHAKKEPRVAKIKVRNRHHYNYRNTEKSYALPKRSGTEITTRHKAPHELLVENWNRKVLAIQKKIDEKASQVDDFEKKDLAKSKNNHFVDDAKFLMVTENLAATRERVRDVEVALKKLKHKYENVKDGFTETVEVK